MATFSEVPQIIDLPRIERKNLRFWKKSDIFKKRLAKNIDNERWSLIDGPITANNPMGVHHAWGRTYKDLYQRYKAMRGYSLRYQNGFDCQGLWVEVEVEKELGFKSKRDIEDYGTANFVKRCKQRVLKYGAIQVDQSIRLGYWMNWDDTSLLRKLAKLMDQPEKIITIDGAEGPVTGTVEQIVGLLGTPIMGGSYFTFSDENNYTIWSLLKKCHEKKWLYKGRDVMPWCPRCSTALSQHEITTDGYRELTHPGVTVKFPLTKRANEFLLVWTTTPWTLTSNMAVAVNPEVAYVKAHLDGEIFYLAKASLDKIFSKSPIILEEIIGKDMEHWSYTGPFDELIGVEKVRARDYHLVILWDDVSETEGTGIVHMAPGCGKEDFELSKDHNLPALAPLDEFGVFREGFGWLTGTHVYDSAKEIISNLQEKGLLLKVEEYSHRYPVCWRCGSELVFRLEDEWFISMGSKIDEPLGTKDRDNNLRVQIIDVAQGIQWIPAFGLQQELDWLRNMDDWMISKKRYWGLALPIYECEECGEFDVIGSREELKSRAVEGWDKFEGHSPHRPWIDYVRIKCTKCGALVSRILDVGNPWLDAGIVAYSTLNYRHDRDYWRCWFPANLICESLPGQFRNWFYSMLAMSTIMERRTPFLTCVGYGSVLAEDGREMHKSWGNAIWFDDAVEKMGADVMRWMYCTSRSEANMLFGYGRADEVKKQFLIPLWNIYSFFTTYANLDNWIPKKSNLKLSTLDRWIISRLHGLIDNVTNDLDKFDAYSATTVIQQFVDELSTWYIRRSRRRFWKSDIDEDKNAAYTSLYNCLTTLIRILAPFIPFLTEEIYQNLISRVNPNSPRSVHLNNWPVADVSLIDEELMEDMNLVIKASSLGRSARNRSGIKLRQPLLEVKIAANKEVLDRLSKLTNIIRDELNVKKVSMTTEEMEIVDYRVRLVPELLPEKDRRMFPQIRTALENIDADTLASSLKEGNSIDVEVDGNIVTIMPEEVEIKAHQRNGWVVTEEEDMFIGVNILIDEKLKSEGLSRDIVRRIQNQRKEAGFKIADRIKTYYLAGPRLVEVFSAHGDYISAETLSTVLHNGKPPEEAIVKDYKLDDETLTIGLVITKE